MSAERFLLPHRNNVEGKMEKTYELDIKEEAAVWSDFLIGSDTALA